ncbi:MAG: acetolactate decarboxylase [Flavobacteriaceae bacterium]
MRVVIILFVIGTFLSCDKKGKLPNVYHSGALRTMMSGDLSKTIDLNTLSQKKYLYALGAFEGLQGEIQIFEGVSHSSKVKDSTVAIVNEIEGSASLLVYTEVEKWVENSLFNFASKTDLESLLMNEAKKVGLDTEKPFPFILEGKISELQWHVINWNPKDSVHTHKKHQESGLNGMITNESVRILGFYSNKHKAIFTHHSSNVHMHFTSKDQSLAGHVDDLKIKDSIILKLPSQ